MLNKNKFSESEKKTCLRDALLNIFVLFETSLFAVFVV